MSTETRVAGVPQWDVADRLRKSLRDKGIGVQEMADELGVGRNTVSNYINGHTSPSGPALRLWALRCGVPIEWLRDGVETSTPPPSGMASDGHSHQYLRTLRTLSLAFAPPLPARGLGLAS